MNPDKPLTEREKKYLTELNDLYHIRDMMRLHIQLLQTHLTDMRKIALGTIGGDVRLDEDANLMQPPNMPPMPPQGSILGDRPRARRSRVEPVPQEYPRDPTPAGMEQTAPTRAMDGLAQSGTGASNIPF